MRDRYSIVVGLLFLAIIVVATVSTIEGGGGGETLGLDRLPPRWPLPEFAVPDGGGQARRRRQRRPGRLRNRRRFPVRRMPRGLPPAASTSPEAIRVCDLFDRPLVISFWFTKGGNDCVEQQDVVEQVYRRYRGRVGFLSLDIRDDRDTVRDLIRQRGWTMPVGYDRDGAVGGLYGVGVCPTFAYVYPGGTLESASIGELTVRPAERAGSTACWPPPPPRNRAEMGAEPAEQADWAGCPRRSQGWVAPHIASEFPGLGIAWVEVDARPGRSPEPVRRRLRDLSDRFYGSQAIQMRERPIPWAYRVFFRQIGLDPDRTRTPIEQLALDRLHDGGFKSHGLPTDALTVAIVETGVALRAFDADRVEGRLCIRDSAPGESLPGMPGELAKGTPHRRRRIAAGRPALRRRPPRASGSGADSRRLAVAAVQVKGVPQIAVEEALWMAASTLER